MAVCKFKIVTSWKRVDFNQHAVFDDMIHRSCHERVKSVKKNFFDQKSNQM